VYVVTNRVIDESKTGLAMFGSTPNPAGPNELRLVEVTKAGGAYQTTLLKDELDPLEVKKLRKQFKIPNDFQGPYYASLRAACDTLARAVKEQRQVLIYVHGYNNDISDVLDTAEALEALYQVVVIPFSWPANGGGVVTGTAAYLDDKKDARASMDALNSCIAKVKFYHELLTRSGRERIWKEAEAKFKDNTEAAREDYSAQVAKECQITLNLACHSLGNYVLKYAMVPRSAASRELVFDNVAMLSADTNNPGHQDWVESLQVRNRLYILINEDDYALAWSRRKPGDEQLERLGSYVRNLNARNAYYIDATGAPAVKNSHNYFTGEPVQQNQALRDFFAAAFEGRRGEQDLQYAADRNLYRWF
jgi:esterase/lipase superfamily enzyme